MEGFPLRQNSVCALTSVKEASVCRHTQYMWLYLQEAFLFLFLFFFSTTVHLVHRFAAVHQTAGLFYQRQAACTAFYWFSTNVVTCRDTDLSACLLVRFHINLLSACLIQFTLMLLYFFFFFIFSFCSPRIPQWACRWHCSEHGEEMD